MIPGLEQADISRVHERIAPFIRHTPVLQTNGADLGLEPFTLTLKLEFTQHGGSFKARGAFCNLLTRPVPPSGVVAASGGNHGIAVAYAARQLGVPAKIFVPTVSSPVKVDRIRSCGADVVVTGDRYADAFEASCEYASVSGALPVHAYDQLETLLGQGTLGRELSDQVPSDVTVFIAVGGGGLLGGVAAWYAGQHARVVGVEPREAPTLSHALAAGTPVDAPAGGIAKDSLAPRRVGELMFPIAQKFVDRVLLVEDADILHAQAILWETFRIVVEPGGAAAFAALSSGRYRPAPDEHVVVVLCGGNAQLPATHG